MESSQDSASSRRRRRKSSSRSTLRWNAPENVSKWMKYGAIAMGIAFVGLSIKEFRGGYAFYGEYSLGQSRMETLYGFNAPQFVSNNGGAWQAAPARDQLPQFNRWRYTPSSGVEVEFHFDGADKAEQIACGGRVTLQSACPSAFGVSLNDDEDTVIAKIGKPSREIFAGPSKTMVYPELGLQLRLEQFIVTKITLERPQGMGLMRFLQWAVP